jgi:hypothetical protein
MKYVVVACAAVVLGGCEFNSEQTGPVEHETRSVELDKSEMVRVEMKMGAGELQVQGGSPKLMDADFSYNVPSWKPLVRYEASSFRGQLTVEQPRSSHGRSNITYKWDLRLNDGVPLDVIADLGAGQARMDLGSLNLRSVTVNMGVGELRLDLRGTPKRDYDVHVHGGVGHAIVNLPKDVGVDANATGGIGHISVTGLEREGNRWRNPGHENARVTIHLDVEGGIGDIELIAN